MQRTTITLLQGLTQVLDRHHLDRVTGALLGSLKVGPARRDSFLYGALQRAGVLARSPSSWADAPVLESLPWGARRVAADAPAAPSGIKGPWPQPSVLGDAFYPAVLNLEDADRVEHFKYNAARYLGQIVRLAPGAAADALLGTRLRELDDAAFVRAFTETSMGQFVVLGIDEPDRADFAPIVASRPDAAWATIDLSFSPVAHLLPGVYAAPTVTLLERVRGDDYRLRAIRVGARVLTPKDGDAFRLAKLFVLQGAQIRLVTSTHPRLHFGADAVNAVTRTVLPEGHVVRRLLKPHMQFTLGLHEAVIHHRRSVVHNSQREVYTPFPFATEGMHALIGAGRHGVAGRAAYPAYRYDDGLLFGEHVPYGRYRRAWWETLHGFVAETLAGFQPDDAIRAWADYIAPWVPGFPTGAEIAHDGNLARVVTSFIATVSVFHTADHHSYASIPLETLPFRLRVPSPDRTSPVPPLDLDALVHPEDFFRHRLSHAMFYEPVIITSLRRARHDVPEAASARAWVAMDALDAEWEGSSFPSSTRIAASLQY